ncbi:MAG: MerR family transcriptional regulator [Deltaproteobacteria bacterium]|nr:MerR family transcriptional regulator [Deltaproteobacteria bacterium]
MSVLARLAGVPAATIKHYVREGLLPQAEVRTSKNMAFYDVAAVDRIRRIKTLQREQFLPLRIIKAALDGEPAVAGDLVAANAIERALDTLAETETRSRQQLIDSGMPPEELAFFEGLGLVAPVVRDGQEVFTGDDLALLRVLGAARREGITAEMLPADTLMAYVTAIGQLARVELDMFRKGVFPKAPADLARITEAATRLSEQLVVLVRRKMLLPALRALVEESKAPSSDAPAKGKAKKRAVRTRR